MHTELHKVCISSEPSDIDGAFTVHILDPVKCMNYSMIGILNIIGSSPRTLYLKVDELRLEALSRCSAHNPNIDLVSIPLVGLAYKVPPIPIK